MDDGQSRCEYEEQEAPPQETRKGGVISHTSAQRVPNPSIWLNVKVLSGC